MLGIFHCHFSSRLVSFFTLLHTFEKKQFFPWSFKSFFSCSKGHRLSKKNLQIFSQISFSKLFFNVQLFELIFSTYLIIFCSLCTYFVPLHTFCSLAQFLFHLEKNFTHVSTPRRRATTKKLLLGPLNVARRQKCFSCLVYRIRGGENKEIQTGLLSNRSSSNNSNNKNKSPL